MGLAPFRNAEPDLTFGLKETLIISATSYPAPTPKLMRAKNFEAVVDARSKKPESFKSLKSGQSLTVRCDSRQPISKDDAARVRQGELAICVTGEVGYSDELGTQRRMSFLRTYDLLTRRFV